MMILLVLFSTSLFLVMLVDSVGEDSTEYVGFGVLMLLAVGSRG